MHILSFVIFRIENKFQILLKEMNEVSEKLARDNERLKHLEVQHKEKLEFLVRVHEEFMVSEQLYYRLKNGVIEVGSYLFIICI